MEELDDFKHQRRITAVRADLFDPLRSKRRPPISRLTTLWGADAAEGADPAPLPDTGNQINSGGIDARHRFTADTHHRKQ